MMGGSGPMELPPLKVSCGVCVVRALDPAAITLGEAEMPADSVTVVAGTPVCAAHGLELVAAIVSGGRDAR